MNLSSDLKFLIYKTTNLINGKYYVGKHQTKNVDDGYQGSGKLLKRAIRKYGVENFQTEILEVYDQEWKMDLAEKILVVTDPEVSYNLCSGGHGGFGFINSHPNHIEWSVKGGKIGTGGYVTWFKYQHLMLKNLSNGIPFEKGHKIWLGKTHTEDSKRKIGLGNKQKGQKNSQFGTIWITDGIENRKIKKHDLIPQGFYQGRSLRVVSSVV